MPSRSKFHPPSQQHSGSLAVCAGWYLFPRTPLATPKSICQAAHGGVVRYASDVPGDAPCKSLNPQRPRWGRCVAPLARMAPLAAHHFFLRETERQAVSERSDGEETQMRVFEATPILRARGTSISLNANAVTDGSSPAEPQQQTERCHCHSLLLRGLTRKRATRENRGQPH